MSLFNFIVKSYVFKSVILVTLLFGTILWISNIVFDYIWRYDCMNPLNDLTLVYKIPAEYDAAPKINLKLLNKEYLCIEGNQKFKLISQNKDFNYYDTVKAEKPTDNFSYTNNVYLNFQNSDAIDSIFFVVSKSLENKIYWNQIFFSSITINSLNEFSTETNQFRTDFSKIVSKDLLADNDTLINMAINYFNSNEKNLGLAECGTNSKILRSICEKYNIPSRIITLQGGNAEEAGYEDRIGYPLHVVCELYSSKYKKWFVLDPTFGSEFKHDEVPLNAVEISNKVFFKKVSDISRDSVLTTGRMPLEKDYFKYYENIYFDSDYSPGLIERQLLKLFYHNYKWTNLFYSIKMAESKTASAYGGLKSLMYLLISIIYLITIFIILAVRLLKTKRS
jgi:hypothetical protein